VVKGRGLLDLGDTDLCRLGAEAGWGEDLGIGLWATGCIGCSKAKKVSILLFFRRLLKKISDLVAFPP